MIHRVEFHNFKGLRDVTVDLQRLTVIVGPNASGKTSILEGLCYVVTSAHGGRPDKLFANDKIPWMLATSGVGDGWSVMCMGDAWWARLALAKESERDFTPPPLPPDIKPPSRSNAEGILISDGQKVAKLARWSAGALTLGGHVADRAVLLRLDVKGLTAASYSDESVPRLSPDGEGLASVLAYMAFNEPEDFQRVLDALRSVVPTVRALRFPRAAVTRTESRVITVDNKPVTYQEERQYWGNSIEFDMEGAPRIPADMVSEGTMLVLGLLTAVLGPDRPNVILLDDLDRALHPKAQKDLVDLLRRLLDNNPSMQIVATSHSPYLLDHLRPEEVRLTALKDDGSVACGRLEDHPEFEKWKEAMTPGEFWSMVGEQWLVGTRAREEAT